MDKIEPIEFNTSVVSVREDGKVVFALMDHKPPVILCCLRGVALRLVIQIVEMIERGDALR